MWLSLKPFTVNAVNAESVRSGCSRQTMCRSSMHMAVVPYIAEALMRLRHDFFTTTTGCCRSAVIADLHCLTAASGASTEATRAWQCAICSRGTNQTAGGSGQSVNSARVCWSSVYPGNLHCGGWIIQELHSHEATNVYSA